MKLISYLFFLLVTLLGFVFAILNADPVQLNLYFTDLRSPLSLLLVFALMLGGLLGIFASLVFYLRLSLKCRTLKKRAEIAEREVESLRALPIQGGH